METCFGRRVVTLLWFMALTAHVCPSAWGKGCNKEQKRALLEMRNSTDGQAFNDFDGGDCCESVGICCHSSSRTPNFIHLSAINTPSRTWIPNVTLFTFFGELEKLYLDGINIGGELQPFCELKRLKYLRVLDLRSNTLEGNIPSCFGMFESLEVLDLSRNRFHGNLPSSIFSNHSKIMTFDGSSNQLDGNIPSYLGIIQVFHISNNRFQGNVPSSIFSNQSQISSFDVSGNQLQGQLSFSIFANSSMEYLDLSGNYGLEVETESPLWIPTFQLKMLVLVNCNLNKKTGHVVPSFISTQINLEYLDISSNSLEGGIPCQMFFNTSIRYLYLGRNKIEGSFLDCIINGTSKLQLFDISDNHVKGLLPENFGNLFSFLFRLDMSSNELKGNIPPSFGSISSLKILDLSNNMLSGTIPQSLTGNDIPLVYLNLSNNTLQGEMLPRDSNITELVCLYLSGNHFEGKISPTISNSSLVILDVRNNNLSGNIPMWLYDHPHLVAVLLRGNQLEGHLTQRLCRMQRLQVFDVSHNRLSGGIPSCLDNVTFWKKSSPSSTHSNYFAQNDRFYYIHADGMWFIQELDFESMFRIKDKEYTFQGLPLLLMTGIDLSSNQLTGGIPIEMGELSQVRSLNLSKNYLTGSIPISFQNLKNVESLDLSHNKLRGKIPSGLVELTSLSTMSVAYNNLFGRIPFERQFSTFGMQCYEGNPELCGDPLPRKCSGSTSTNQQKDDEQKIRIIDRPLFFYAFVTVSYALGFWAFFGILIIKKNWRQNYFRAVDEYIESFFKFLSKYR